MAPGQRPWIMGGLNGLSKICLGPLHIAGKRGRARQNKESAPGIFMRVWIVDNLQSKLLGTGRIATAEPVFGCIEQVFITFSMFRCAHDLRSSLGGKYHIARALLFLLHIHVVEKIAVRIFESLRALFKGTQRVIERTGEYKSYFHP